MQNQLTKSNININDNTHSRIKQFCTNNYNKYILLEYIHHKWTKIDLLILKQDINLGIWI